ncbi:MAG: DUF11 domain-containing protein [Gammaproteobacteria bacterium]|nr:DUF11 domain-containing protein [Gammaproteobacteria bacterium]
MSQILKTMKSSHRQTARTRVRRRIGQCAVILCVLSALSSAANAATVRDEFSSRTWSNNDGTVAWSGDWIEVDGNSTPPSPTNGNVWITNGGELRVEDQPNTGGQPSAAREANLAGATVATLSFDWRTTSGVDNSDSVIVEVSANGGGTWTTLENFTGLNGSNSGSRSYNITAYATANTRVRIRVNNLYGGGNESFRLDFIEIDYQVVLTGTELSVTQTDTPDPVNVASNMSYTLSVANAGPEDATGVTVTDTLPAGVTFQSASATQGSCSHAAGIVTCFLGNMVSGANATINIAVTAPVVTGTITNSATVTGNETDPIPGNNTSNENTVVQNLNVNQLCYLVADSGGGSGGNDLFTRIDTADFNPATNETNIGTGTGTNSIEAIAFNSATGVVYGANGGRLGTLSTVSGVFQPLPQTFGTGGGAFGNITFGDVDGLAYDATTGVLYGAHARGGTDVLIQINMTTGAHVPNAFGAGVDYVAIVPVLSNTITDDIAIDPTTGIMYASVNSGGSSDRLIRVNKLTGATTDVALITVPDIEGLGTDPTGQLWGTSGTQRILYEINKSTGVGSNGRTINNGSDYESVDCFALSPSVTADLNVGKTVDDATPAEGDTITYTVTVTNAGPGPATVVQLMDLLPSGVTLVSATPGQGTYDAITGDWYVGNIPVGGNVTLLLQASVDTGTGGTTITNTASVDFLSQIDTNPANDIATVDINPLGTPNLTVVKAVATLEDPINGTVDPLAIPGATMRYLILTTNTGSGQVDTDTLIVTDPVPANTALRVLDFDGSTAGPVQFIDGSTASGLSYSFIALDDVSDDVAFSDDGGATFDYEPTADANGVDLAVTDIRINPKNAFAGNAGGGDPSMQLAFKVLVQ